MAATAALGQPSAGPLLPGASAAAVGRRSSCSGRGRLFSPQRTGAALSSRPAWRPPAPGASQPAGRRARCAALPAGSAPLSSAAAQVVDDFIRSSQVVGLCGGQGSLLALEHLAAKIKAGALKDITLVPGKHCPLELALWDSVGGCPIVGDCPMGAALGPLRYDRSAMLGAEIASFGIPMTTLEELKLQQRQVDVALSDADTVQEGTLYSIIGRRDVPGRASILKEKAIAAAATQFVVLVTADAFVEQLQGSVPVEIQQLDWLDIAEEVDDIFIGEAEVWRRPSSGSAGPMGGDFPFVTESGHFVLDVRFNGPISSPEDVAKELATVAGVVAHGVYLQEAHAAAVAYSDGVKIRTSLFRESFTSSQANL